MNLEEALKTLEFPDVKNLPKLKEIQKQFRKLCILRHPDKNGGTEEATADFQKLLHAYQVAGDAADQIKPEENDDEDIIARKIFEQFQFSSVKVNSQSITIKTEKNLNSTWVEILTTNFGQPIDKGVNGKKFTMVDRCDDASSHVFLTLYHTGNLLIQAGNNIQSKNIHFLNCHLQDLFMQVYNRAKLLQKLPNLSHKTKTPLRKPTKSSRTIQHQIKCPKCEYQTTATSHLAKHMKKEHGDTSKDKLSVMIEEVTPLKVIEVKAEVNAVIKADAKAVEKVAMTNVPVNATSKSEELLEETVSIYAKFHCMLCGAGFREEVDLTTHENEIHEVKCDICAHTFYTDDDLKNHMLHTHAYTKTKAQDQPNIKDDNSIEHHDTHHDDSFSDIKNKVLIMIAEDLSEELKKEPTMKKSETDAVVEGSGEPVTEVYFECEQCPLRVKHINDLNEHKESQHQTKKCHECDFQSSSEYAFNLHIQNDHGPNINQEPVKQVQFNQPLIFPCPFCGTNFDEIADLDLHVAKRHETPEQPTREEMMKTLSVKQYMSILMEENLDVMEELRRFRKSVFESLNEIITTQDDLRGELKKLLDNTNQQRAATNRVEGEQVKAARRMEELHNQVTMMESQHDVINKNVEQVHSTVASLGEKVSTPTKTNVSDTNNKNEENDLSPVEQKCDKCDFTSNNVKHLKAHMLNRHKQYFL